MKFGIVRFPGNSFANDCYFFINSVLGQSVDYIRHDNNNSLQYDCVILPGGASFGDYLRCGALAAQTPVIKELLNFADKGGTVIGIGNGFQLLTECNLLPGALVRNKSDKFISQSAYISVTNKKTIFTSSISFDTAKVSLAHGYGQFIADEEVLYRIENEERVVFRYSDIDGRVVEEGNVDGSVNNIAGIVNWEGNVLGIMALPERIIDKNEDYKFGRAIFKSLLSQISV